MNEPSAAVEGAGGEEVTLDRLTGSWWIHQLKRGHRFSTDDIVTGWRAALAKPGRDALRLLDLGCGIGTVGLATLHFRGCPGDTLLGVEAQALSVELARRTVAHNHLEARVQVVHADLRTFDAQGSRFDLITGSPPYLPLGTGVVSPHPQRAACRFELRGSVVDYCVAARRWLAPDGVFCFVMAAADPRAESAPVAAGLRVVERWDYVFRHGEPPLVSTLVCELDAGSSSVQPRAGALVVRGPDGRWTQEYLALRVLMGFDPLDPARNPVRERSPR